MTKILCVRVKKETAAELERRARIDGQDVEEALSLLIETMVERVKQ